MFNNIKWSVRLLAMHKHSALRFHWWLIKQCKSVLFLHSCAMPYWRNIIKIDDEACFSKCRPRDQTPYCVCSRKCDRCRRLEKFAPVFLCHFTLLFINCSYDNGTWKVGQDRRGKVWCQVPPVWNLYLCFNLLNLSWTVLLHDFCFCFISRWRRTTFSFYVPVVLLIELLYM